MKMNKNDRLMRVIFRVDANTNIGMGHVMRCLSIADEFSKMECAVRFVISTDDVLDLINNRGYEAIVLHSDYLLMDKEKWLFELEADIIIVDSYYVTASFLSNIQHYLKRVGGKLIYIDDVFLFPYPVDMLINYNAYGTASIYNQLYEGRKTPSLILGPTYAPLRSMFQNIPRTNQKKKVMNVLFSTGGTDNIHLTLSLIKAIQSGVLDRMGYTYHFLLGTMNADKDLLNELADGDCRIVLHENIKDMRSLIQSVDLVVSAAGSTLYEVAACGVPLVTYSFADNQVSGAEAFGRLGLAMNVGDLRKKEFVDSTRCRFLDTLDDLAVERILGAVETIADDYNRRCEMGNLMQEMIDGFGAARIAQKIINMKSL